MMYEYNRYLVSRQIYFSFETGETETLTTIEVETGAVMYLPNSWDLAGGSEMIEFTKSGMIT